MDKPPTEGNSAGMPKETASQLWDPVRQALEEQGFPVSGVVDYEAAKALYASHASRYREWIDSGKHGEMGYLERGMPRRLDPSLVFPELKSIIAVLRPYSPRPVGDETLRYARYLNGPDYHSTLKEGLENAFSTLRGKGALPAEFRYKICVDTSAVLERTWAALAGLGWIGKNTLLIHPQLGSYVFIGVVFTNHGFGASPVVLKDYCGPCTRCLTACPTRALEPHDLDSRKCISYLTLEKRGEWDAAYETKGFVAGCDLCQEVCPYNSKAVRRAPETGIAEYLRPDAESLFAESEEAYRSRIAGTALERVKYRDFQRNLDAIRRSGSRKE